MRALDIKCSTEDDLQLGDEDGIRSAVAKQLLDPTLSQRFSTEDLLTHFFFEASAIRSNNLKLRYLLVTFMAQFRKELNHVRGHVLNIMNSTRFGPIMKKMIAYTKKIWNYEKS
jgi:hypothetical protein